MGEQAGLDDDEHGRRHAEDDDDRQVRNGGARVPDEPRVERSHRPAGSSARGGPAGMFATPMRRRKTQ